MATAKSSRYADQELLDIEYKYMFGSNLVSSEITTDIVVNESNDYSINSLSEKDLSILEALQDNEYLYGDNNYYDEAASTYSIFPTIDDSIFKSITSYNTWKHVKDDNQPYSYWQYGYLGTNNPA